MKTYAFDFINNRMFAYNSRKEALSAGNGRTLASDETELNKANCATGAFVELYNRHCETKIQRFSDRQNAVKRIFALAEAKATLVESSTNTEDTMTKLADEKNEDKDTAKAAAKAAKAEAAVKAKADKAEASAAKKAEKEAAKAAKADKPAGEKGRESANKGATIVRSTGWPTDGTVPGRDGSFRKTSFTIVSTAPDAGISFEDYVAAGGRPGELAFGLYKKYIDVIPAAKAA